MIKTAILVLPLCFCAFAAYAQGKRAIGPAPELACMSLQVTDRQALDPKFSVPIMAEPRGGSTVVGTAASIVLVRSPKIERNGYLATVMFNGKVGWIEEANVQPWRNPGSSGRHCIAAHMSDGSLGFAFQ